MNLSYLKGKAATVLCAVKLLYGITAAVVLYKGITGAVSTIQSVAAFAKRSNITFFSSVSQYFAAIFDSFSFAEQIFDEMFTAGWIAICNMLLLLLFCFFFSMLEPLLDILDAVGCFQLRKNGNGWSIVKNVHFIKSLLFFLGMVSLGVWGIQVFLYRGKMAGAIKTSAAVFLLLALLLTWIIYCYHRDIMKAMDAVAADLRQTPTAPKSNHLSGLSVLFGIFFLLLTAAFFSGFENISTTQTASEENTFFLWILFTAKAVLEAVKYFMVAACNHNRKKAF